MNKLLTFFREVNLWKTLWFNLHYFPLKVALRLPVMVYKRTIVSVAKGSIVLDAPVKTGMVLLGVNNNGSTFEITDGIRIAPTTFETIGEQEITVKHKGHSTTFKVRVTDEEPAFNPILVAVVSVAGVGILGVGTFFGVRHHIKKQKSTASNLFSEMFKDNNT